MQKAAVELWLIRHGETQWSLSGQHTGRTDIPLTDRGRERAVALRQPLRSEVFSLVLSSPMQRAQETCRIAGLGGAMQVDADLMEWDYGIYEGRTTADIRQEQPGWSIWDAPPPEGESLDQIAVRCQRVIARALIAGGKVALFSHAHFLRILAATWIGLEPRGGRLFSLGTASVSRLGFERETRVIQTWNQPPGTG